MKITVNRTEYKTHEFRIHDGATDEEIQDILNDYDWGNSYTHTANEDDNREWARENVALDKAAAKRRRLAPNYLSGNGR